MNSSRLAATIHRTRRRKRPGPRNGRPASTVLLSPGEGFICRVEQRVNVVGTRRKRGGAQSKQSRMVSRSPAANSPAQRGRYSRRRATRSTRGTRQHSHDPVVVQSGYNVARADQLPDRLRDVLHQAIGFGSAQQLFDRAQPVDGDTYDRQRLPVPSGLGKRERQHRVQKRCVLQLHRTTLHFDMRDLAEPRFCPFGVRRVSVWPLGEGVPCPPSRMRPLSRSSSVA